MKRSHTIFASQLIVIFYRSTIDTCRTLTIWMVSLSLGWEVLVWPYSLLQVAGFALLVYVVQSASNATMPTNPCRYLALHRYGTFVFNGLVKPIILAPSAIALPREGTLAHTGELPSSAAESRAGYDVLPENETLSSGSRTPTGR